MIVEILDWSGTILIIIAAFIIAHRKASNPNIRIKGLWLFFISNIVWIPLGFILNTPGFLLTQCILLAIDVKGIINCNKELRKDGRINR